MSQKIVAIGGGENGRLRTDGTRHPYETAPMDREIIRLTGKRKPNFLLLAHSQPPEREGFYFQTMSDIYGRMYGCSCKNLFVKELKDREIVQERIAWADIIYEGGGDTVSMMALWQKTGLDAVLRQAWQDGKVMCGVSAGANCWFSLFSSDSLKIQRQEDSAPLIKASGLDFVHAFFTPHCNEDDRLSCTKEMLKTEELVGIACSNCAAIEIVDGQYRILTSREDAYALKTYWLGEEYMQKIIEPKNDWENLNELLEIWRNAI